METGQSSNATSLYFPVSNSFFSLSDAAHDLCYQLSMAKSSRHVPLNVLFVCIGNSCRSQMAEALANQAGKGRIRAWSAGSFPLGEIIPQTHEVLREKGLTLRGHWSKGLKDVQVDKMDVVVGMGCEVHCPVPAGFTGRVIEWNIPDPYGHDLAFFRDVRDLIERQVKALLDDLNQQSKSVNARPAATPAGEEK
jgi:arsenate reductase (thioredoxin)